MGFQVGFSFFEGDDDVGGDEGGVVFHPFALAGEGAVGVLEGGGFLDEGDAPVVFLVLGVDDDGLAVGDEGAGHGVVIVVEAALCVLGAGGGHAGIFVDGEIFADPVPGGFDGRVVVGEAGVDHAFEARRRSWSRNCGACGGRRG